ncbi:Pyrimidine monooxygenase RutA [Penicillium expansum]|uniref:Pyrimidine monooxygenase RutA n=1 Tax=Penicillium expansum TaxID=27334 RepID=A0A0A2JBH2_PENEN|nr:Pyrimidine monooxygenase RutA [Penicillium expansum]KGO43663.1 Pyrimidine monooxygenase RutA [Penicillium expansum]KGO52689.1 Pyrimidine monooxygenase RutA [Penicillium expansum]KGO57844.1 Pyrimidine monooxygenase RutA [Penicillium expansum]
MPSETSKTLDIGVFLPIGNDGWLISTAAPHYKPSFGLNCKVAKLAESYGFDFALSMIKFRGFGGKTEHWDYNLESFTLMAGIAACTSRIKLFASTAVLALPPAICARMAVTIDDIANSTAEAEQYKNRFGVNMVTGWQSAEFTQMGLWPGNEYFGYRYDYAEEYVRIMKELWKNGKCDLDGKYFKMDDCRLEPRPAGEIKIIAAGQSDRGTKFAADYADYNFTLGKGINAPTAFADSNQRLVDAAKETGRDVGAMILMMLIMDETDEAAEAKWKLYCDNLDEEAVAWVHSQSKMDTKADAQSMVARFVEGASAGHLVNLNGGTLVGSYSKVAGLLDEIAEVEGVKGVMLQFDEFLSGVELFGKYVQPKMKTRVGKDPRSNGV